MIPSVQYQTCNDNTLMTNTTTTNAIHKDILEKFDMPMPPLSLTSNNNCDDVIQLTNQMTHDFESDQQIMHQVEFNDSDIAISHDCNPIELQTNGETIDAVNDDNGQIINYTIIGNGLILIDGSQFHFDDETKNICNDLMRPLNG